MFDFTLLIAILILLVSPIFIFKIGKWNVNIAKWTAFAATLLSAVFVALTLGEVLIGNIIHEEAWQWLSFQMGSKDFRLLRFMLERNLLHLPKKSNKPE